MSGGFSFPPPPPPPPKATGTTSTQNSYPNRGQEHGRNFVNNRGGRGGHNRGGFSRQDNHFGPGPSPANARNAWSQPTSPFHRPSSDQNTFASTNSRNSQNALGSSEYASHTGPRLQPNQSIHSAQHSSITTPLSRTLAGHKRKLEALRGETKEMKLDPQPMPAIPDFGAPFASPIIINNKVPTSVEQDRASRSKNHVRSLGLVPGDESPQYSSSEDENDETKDLDEEAMYAEMGDKLTFEHNGIVISLASQADLIAWRKERRNNWPTRARMTEKEKERVRVGRERRRLLASSHLLQSYSNDKPSRCVRKPLNACKEGVEEASQQAFEMSEGKESQTPQNESQNVKMVLQTQIKTLEDLRRKVAESEARNREARAKLGKADQMVDEVSQDATQTPAENNGANAEPKENLTSFSTGRVESVMLRAEYKEPAPSAGSTVSVSSPAGDSNDSGPEEIASKPAVLALPISKRVCRYFSANGRCRDGENCGYLHDTSSNLKLESSGTNDSKPSSQARRSHVETTKNDSSNHRTISQRLTEQEEEQEARLALRVIKYLGSVGFFAQ